MIQLLFFFFFSSLTNHASLCFAEMPDRTGSTGSLLPLSNKEKNESSAEGHKLLNGNSDTADWV